MLSATSPFFWSEQARFIAAFIANFTSNTSRRVVGQWGGAGGASCEDHFCLALGVGRFRAASCVVIWLASSGLRDASNGVIISRHHFCE